MDKLEFLRQNPLFQGFSDIQLQQILPIVHELQFNEGDIIIHENEVSDNIYLIKSGEVEIRKQDIKHEKAFKIAILKVGDIVGEITLLDNAPRSASVRASKPCVLYAISANELRAISKEQLPSKIIAEKLTLLAQEAVSIASEPVYSIIIQNLAKSLGQRIRVTSDAVVESLGKELEHTKARAALGVVIIVTLSFLSFYVLFIKIMTSIPGVTTISTAVTVPLLACFSIGMFIIMQKGGYPLQTYGLTLENWKRHVIEACIFTIPLLPLIIFFKWILIHYAPAWSTHALFDLSTHPEAHFPLSLDIAELGLYLVFVPIQELIARGALQSSFQILLVGPHKTLWAIILSNILFSVTHLHLSITIGLATIIPGLFWGWLYSRQGSLVGVIISHLIVGIWALFIVGFGV